MLLGDYCLLSALGVSRLPTGRWNRTTPHCLLIKVLKRQCFLSSNAWCCIREFYGRRTLPVHGYDFIILRCANYAKVCGWWINSFPGNWVTLHYTLNFFKSNCFPVVQRKKGDKSNSNMLNSRLCYLQQGDNNSFYKCWGPVFPATEITLSFILQLVHRLSYHPETLIFIWCFYAVSLLLPKFWVSDSWIGIHR